MDVVKQLSPLLTEATHTGPSAFIKAFTFLGLNPGPPKPTAPPSRGLTWALGSMCLCCYAVSLLSKDGAPSLNVQLHRSLLPTEKHLGAFMVFPNFPFEPDPLVGWQEMAQKK